MNNDIFAAFVYGIGATILTIVIYKSEGYIVYIGIIGIVSYIGWLVVTLILNAKKTKKE